MSEVPVTNFDIIFVSYDEDNADDNWADLQKKCPWAKRIHGVFGSDAAHKAAARLSNTDRFTTCDADSIIKPDFFNVTIPKEIAEDMTKTISWSSMNHVNGLIYGNGSLKAWTKPFVESMKTHEESDQPKNQVEFCFESGYTQRNEVFSITYPNGSPRQAWRSGFREGVKMTLDQGIKIPVTDLKQNMYWKNMIRLLVWCSVGTDVQHGLWCIYGARMGVHMTNLTDWDYINVRDFEYLNDMWNDDVSPKFESYTSPHMCTNSGYCWDNDKLISEVIDLGKEIRDHLDFDIAELNENASKFFRKVFINPARVEIQEAR
ncbi:hypothetical protein KAR91_82140 [Candidatus Pacearchaeota archaeon]|nr:hypothetical protein [Candidatus Pacearchaeota archaeon]